MRGVRDLQGILDRCRVDDLTGCWLWSLAVITPRGSTTPVAYLPPGVLGRDKAQTMSAAKAAWLLSGRSLPAGHVVWRHVCADAMCVNPAHCRSGTRAQMGSEISATGRNQGDPKRAAICARNRMSVVKPAATVREAEAMFARGCLQRDVRAALGISQATAAAIRRGTHPHSAGRQHLVRDASIFTLGMETAA